MSETRHVWYPLRAKTRTAAASSSSRLDSARLRLDELIRSGRQLVVTVGDAAGGMRRPAQRYLPVRDRDVRMVVRLLGDFCHSADEGDRVRKGGELEGSLECTLGINPIGRKLHSSTKYPFSLGS